MFYSLLSYTLSDVISLASHSRVKKDDVPPVSVLCCCNKTMTKNNLERKGFITVYRLESIIEESQGRGSKQDHGL